jgi:hypothetical protein
LTLGHARIAGCIALGRSAPTVTFSMIAAPIKLFQQLATPADRSRLNAIGHLVQMIVIGLSTVHNAVAGLIAVGIVARAGGQLVLRGC